MQDMQAEAIKRRKSQQQRPARSVVTAFSHITKITAGKEKPPTVVAAPSLYSQMEMSSHMIDLSVLNVLHQQVDMLNANAKKKRPPRQRQRRVSKVNTVQTPAINEKA